MGRRSAFAQVLDEKLRALESSDADRVASSTRGRQAALPDPFLFSAPYRSFKASGYPVQARCLAAARRALAVHEQHALAVLNGFGADLTQDFTPSELRSAFRVLARQYHPDRHPSTDSVEKAQLARVFGEIVEHHRQLTMVACR